MPNFRCVVATPSHPVFDGEIAYARVPGEEGDYGVLSGHEGFVGLNRSGVLSLWLDPEGNEKVNLLIHEGSTQVLNDRLTVLPRYAARFEEIDIDAVQAKRDALQKRIDETGAEEVEEGNVLRISLYVLLDWYDLQLKARADGIL